MTQFSTMTSYERGYMAKKYPRTYAREIEAANRIDRLRRPGFNRERHLEIKLKRWRTDVAVVVESMVPDAVDVSEPEWCPIYTESDKIIIAVCAVCDVAEVDLKSSRRFRKLIKPRHLACFLLREYTNLSYPQIGRKLGNRDHTTILHGVQKVKANLPEFQPMISAIERGMDL